MKERICSGFQCRATDSLLYNSMLELCFICFWCPAYPLFSPFIVWSPPAVQSLSNLPRCSRPRQPLRYLSIDFVPFCAWSCVVSCWCTTTSRQGYKGLFAPLLSPSVWERKGNIPAVTRLLQVRGYKLEVPLESL